MSKYYDGSKKKVSKKESVELGIGICITIVVLILCAKFFG